MRWMRDLALRGDPMYGLSSRVFDYYPEEGAAAVAFFF
jgi:hypothetical protein